jgi:hypothetical protein
MLTMLEKLAGINQALVPLVNKIKRLRAVKVPHSEIMESIGQTAQRAAKPAAIEAQIQQATKAGIPYAAKLVNLPASTVLRPTMPVPGITSGSKPFKDLREAGSKAALGYSDALKGYRANIDAERKARELANRLAGKTIK